MASQPGDPPAPGPRCQPSQHRSERGCRQLGSGQATAQGIEVASPLWARSAPEATDGSTPPPAAGTDLCCCSGSPLCCGWAVGPWEPEPLSCLSQTRRLELPAFREREAKPAFTDTPCSPSPIYCSLNQVSVNVRVPLNLFVFMCVHFFSVNTKKWNC